MSFIFRLKLRLLQESENNMLLDLGTVEGGELCLAVTSKSYMKAINHLQRGCVYQTVLRNFQCRAEEEECKPC